MLAASCRLGELKNPELSCFISVDYILNKWKEKSCIIHKDGLVKMMQILNSLDCNFLRNKNEQYRLIIKNV